ncbi:MAG: hypothetical protein JO340_05155 [Acidobacteriaceae bacterium]|nr:hypothetical protein [Acidobacteriaceae bacterium]
MGGTRRAVLISMAATALAAQDQQPRSPAPRLPNPNEEEDQKLPNGKSQKDAIAKEEHEAALRDTEELIAMAQQLKEELQKAGNYVVPVSSMKKTEEIEKLARRIRSRLKQ